MSQPLSSDPASGFDVLLNFAKEPRPGIGPVTFGRGFRNAENLRGFLNRQTGKESELHQFGFDSVVRGQTFERLMDSEQSVVVHPGGEFQAVGVNGNSFGVAAVPAGLFSPRIVDEDAAHRLGRSSEKVGAILPRRLTVAPEAQPRLVDQRRGLERLTGRFAGQLQRGEFPQLAVDKGQNRIRRSGVAISGTVQQNSKVIHGKLTLDSDAGGSALQ